MLYNNDVKKIKSHALTPLQIAPEIDLTGAKIFNKPHLKLMGVSI